MTRRLAAAVLALAAAGCATVPAGPAGEGPAVPIPVDRAVALAGFDDWRAAGRVAVRTAVDGWSASFDWRETGFRSELAVRGPFGAGGARIVRTADRITLETGDDPPVEVPAPFAALDGALVERLGFPLPVEYLRWWLAGVPAPGLPSTPVADGFEQAGWSVRPQELGGVAGAPAALPKRVVLEREDTRIRVAIDRWVPAPTDP
ncbi:MAG: outer membrane lipoprotein LolB [Steroidobacteraceae bacterium]|jgi:outer membrane lipoprotein LolB|nr:outer membrane lipoprotein LolB [Steroidobacteraceae bacterium]